MRIGRAGNRISSFLEAGKGLAGGNANIKAAARGAEGAVPPPVDEPPLCFFRFEDRALCCAGKKSLTKRKSHRRIISPSPCVQAERPSPDHICDVGIGVPRLELEGRAQSIADRQTNETSNGPIVNALDRSKVIFLRFRLDSARPNLSYFGDCGIGACDAEFDEQSRCYCAGPAQPSPAMDKDALPVVEETAQSGSGLVPSLLEFLARRRDVGDRELKPFHPASSNGSLQICDPQQLDFVLFNKRDDSGAPPLTHRVQIRRKVTLPLKASERRPLLTGTKGDADAS